MRLKVGGCADLVSGIRGVAVATRNGREGRTIDGFNDVGIVSCSEIKGGVLGWTRCDGVVRSWRRVSIWCMEGAKSYVW